MGLLSKFFNSTGMVYAFSDWGGKTNTSSGQVVTYENAVNLGIVYSAIDIKAKAVAKNPFNVYQDINGEKTRVKDHQIAKLLSTRPNPKMSPYQFLYQLTVHRNLYGVAYVRLVYTGNKVTELHLLYPPSVIVELIDDKRYFVDTFTPDQQVFSEEEILFLPYMTIRGIPKSPITVARETIGTMRKQQRFLGSFYGQGTLSRGALKTNQSLNKDAKDKIRKGWEDANSGEDNASRIAILDSGIEFQNLTIPLQDAEFITSMNYGVKEIARIFGIPPYLLGEHEKGSYSSFEQLSMDFIQNTILPECVAIESEMNYKAFTPTDQKKGYYTKFDLSSSLRGDIAARTGFYEKGISSGFLCINDVRTMEDLPKVEGGDKFRVDLNHVSLDMADEYQLTKASNTNPNQ